MDAQSSWWALALHFTERSRQAASHFPRFLTVWQDRSGPARASSSRPPATDSIRWILFMWPPRMRKEAMGTSPASSRSAEGREDIAVLLGRSRPRRREAWIPLWKRASPAPAAGGRKSGLDNQLARDLESNRLPGSLPAGQEACSLTIG